MPEGGDTGRKDRHGGAEGEAAGRKGLHFVNISITLEKMTAVGREENGYE